ncbi:MAG: class I SAM-dependent methyltransferase [Planctomycetes bacterium]|nr:class I SAM-dependent methyltransferase [Planctomycetota bacterium]
MTVFTHPAFEDYALLDSGRGEKLERMGKWVVRRPDPQALWEPRLPETNWLAADWSFARENDRGGRWESCGELRLKPEWEVGWQGARFKLKLTPFKHVGLFPEQASNWAWFQERGPAPGTHKTMLNLFGYTGAASILAAQSGWQVTHVDAAKPSLNWAAENAQLSQLPNRAIRWICDDASAFAAREVRRKRRYDAILLDPPHYGRGPKGEKWQFERDISGLLESCRQLLSPDPGSFLILSTYAIGYSPIAFENMLREFGNGTIESGELAIPEGDGSRLLPCGFCARFLCGPRAS